MDRRPFPYSYLPASLMLLSVPKMTHKSLQSKMETLKNCLFYLYLSYRVLNAPKAAALLLTR